MNYEQAADVIANISETLSETSLDGDLFPEIQNPFNEALIPNVVGQANQIIGNNPAATTMAAASGFIGEQNTNIDAVKEAQTFASLYPRDTLGNLYNQKKTNKKLT